MKKFWKWKNQIVTNQENNQQIETRTLFLNGSIAEESWFDDEVSPKLFKDELFSGTGDITVWINSPGGDCVAAAQIYNMLIEYSGNVTVKIDGIAASAASVIAMAGTKVLMSPVSQLMIHNPMTVAWGNQAEMERAIAMLGSVKDSIINAYELKTKLSRAKISHLMDAETWMDSGKALELGFIDGVLSRETDPTPSENICTNPTAFSQVQISNSLMDKIAKKCVIEQKQTEATNTVKADFLMDRLNLMKTWR